MNVISFITCRQFREYMESWIDNELEPSLNVAMERHVRDCASCRAFLEDWESYFDFMHTVGPEVYVAPETRIRLKRLIRPTILYWRLRMMQGFRTMLQPVQAASLIFLFVLFSSMFYQPTSVSSPVKLGHVTTVEARSISPEGLEIVYHWSLEPDNRPVTLTRSIVVLDCLDHQNFTLFDPHGITNPYLKDLLGSTRHIGVFEAWCRIIPRAEGRITCSPEGSCNLELHP